MFADELRAAHNAKNRNQICRLIAAFDRRKPRSTSAMGILRQQPRRSGGHLTTLVDLSNLPHQIKQPQATESRPLLVGTQSCSSALVLGPEVA